MVEFCTLCGTSLPEGDLTIRDGRVFTSADYRCPHCGGPASPEKPEEPDPTAAGGDSFLIRGGQVLPE